MARGLQNFGFDRFEREVMVTFDHNRIVRFCNDRSVPSGFHSHILRQNSLEQGEFENSSGKHNSNGTQIFR